MLRRHRYLKVFQAVWRTLAVSGLLGGLVWATTRPNWVLSESNQIVIEGNQRLSKQTIQSLLPLSYPQSLLRIKPEAIAKSLEAQPPIAEATVNRQLFPPGITIQVLERVPVALAVGGGLSPTATKPSIVNPPSTSLSNSTGAVGLLDQYGVWIPLQSYGLSSNLKLPNLKVVGLPEQYRPYWSQLYQAVSHSPIKVFEIDFQDPANLILKTELGSVHLGSYSSRLAEQFNILAQMRQLPSQLSVSQIAYIDLKNPAAPSLQMNQAKPDVKSNTP